MPEEMNINKFNQDVRINDGYLYSESDKLSCRLANKRMSDAVFSMVELNYKRIIDIGCGDGKYTIELLSFNPEYILGVDAAEVAIGLAVAKTKDITNIKFRVADIYSLHNINDHFDIAIVRGVLHHLNDAAQAIQSVMNIADEVIIVEPNGYNPGLKIIEKLSSYHIEHEEKSFYPHTLDKWFKIAGGEVVHSCYCGLVPMFCPDFMAKLLKNIEPLVEKFPICKQFGCAQYVFKVKRTR